MITLDTHAVIWWTTAPKHLGRLARQAIDDADRIGIPAIVFWEAAHLARRGRIDLGSSIAEWSRTVLAIPRVDALAMTAEIAVAAEGLPMHPDPADRFIVATTRQYESSLVTKDDAIRRAKLVPVIW